MRLRRHSLEETKDTDYKLAGVQGASFAFGSVSYVDFTPQLSDSNVSRSRHWHLEINLWSGRVGSRSHIRPKGPRFCQITCQTPAGTNLAAGGC
jgi:hypothetical protein